MKEKTSVELSEEDLKDILCKHFNLKKEKTDLKIIRTEKDRPWDSEYNTIRIEGPKIQ